jgi:hypothetical protein
MHVLMHCRDPPATGDALAMHRVMHEPTIRDALEEPVPQALLLTFLLPGDARVMQ